MYFRAPLCILRRKNLMTLWKVGINRTFQSGGPFGWKQNVFVNTWHVSYM